MQHIPLEKKTIYRMKEKKIDLENIYKRGADAYFHKHMGNERS